MHIYSVTDLQDWFSAGSRINNVAVYISISNNFQKLIQKFIPYAQAYFDRNSVILFWAKVKKYKCVGRGYPLSFLESLIAFG